MSKFNALQDQTKELIYRFPNKGLKRPALEDERDYKIGEYVEPETKVLPKFVDLMNSYSYDQGFTNHCTAYSTAMTCQITSVREKQNFNIEYDPEIQWENQLIEPGTADEQSGDYLQSAIKSLKHFGLIGRGAKVLLGKYYYVPHNEWKQYLADGFPIITGSFCRRPFIDTNYNWRPTRSGGGHAYIIVGYDDSKKAFIAQNSWGMGWGENNAGRFYVKYSDAPQLFRGWALQLSVK